MTKYVKWLLVLSVLAINQPISAEEISLPTPPLEPVVKKAAEYCTWTLVCNPRQSPPALKSAGVSDKNYIAPVLKEVTVIKAGDTFLETRDWSDGSIVQRWIFQGNVLTTRSGSSQITIMTADQYKNLPYAHDYTKSDFPDLDWVTEANFKEVTTYQGHLCYHFHDSASGKLPSMSSSLDAWIDGKTGLPVAVADGEALKVFTFKEMPAQKLELPGPFATALQKYMRLVNDAKGIKN